MRSFVISLVFLFSVLSASAQYGELRSAELPGKPALKILRTSEDLLKQMADTTDKSLNRQGRSIELVERMLESARQGYIVNRLPVLDVQSFLSSIKFLDKSGVNVSYYLEEYFAYYPGSRRR